MRDGETKLGVVSVCAEVPAEKRAHDSGVLFEIRSMLRAHAPLEENLVRAARWIAGKAAACVIDLLNDDGTIERVACASVNAALDKVIPALQGDFPIFPNNRSSAADVLRTSCALGVAPARDPAAFLGVVNVAQRELLAAAGVSAMFAVPVTCSEKAIGIVTLLSTTRVFDDSDAQMLADAAAIIGGVRRACAQRAAAFRRARSASGSALYFKDAFLGTVSHELRTPLQAMLGWTHLMRENLLSPPENDRALAALEESIKAQGKIVNDLLELSRINSGRLRSGRASRRSPPACQTDAARRSGRKPKRSASRSNEGGRRADNAPVWMRADGDSAWFQRARCGISSPTR